MTNAIYPLSKRDEQQALLNLSSVNIKAVLVDLALYTYSAAHQYLSDIPSGARVALSGNLSGKTFGNDGNFDSNNPTFTAVTGPTVEAIVLFEDTGVAGTSRLLVYYDTDVDGLPYTPVGNNVVIHIDSTGWWTL